MRIFWGVGWVVLGSLVVSGQWREVRVDMGRFMIAWGSEGVTVGWVFHHSNPWRIMEFDNWKPLYLPTMKEYVLPSSTWVARYANVCVPWVWVVVSWGAMTLVVVRVKRRREVRAFEVEELVTEGKS